jgi:hypothetical protein
MKRIGVLALSVVAVSCARGPSVAPGPSAAPEPSDVGRTAAIYAAAIDGANEHFKPEWIVPGICARAEAAGVGPCEPMAPELRAELMKDLGKPYRFLSDLEKKQKEIFEGKGGTIHRVGPIEGTGDRVTVPISYYCGGLCAGGSVAVVQTRNGSWTVTGTEGGSWIS